jgi:hypothetical protein
MVDVESAAAGLFKILEDCAVVDLAMSVSVLVLIRCFG